MRHFVMAGFMVLLLAVCSDANAFRLPGFSNNQVDVSSLISRADTVKRKVSMATISLGEGLADVLDMAGKPAEAKELREQISATKADSADFEKIELLSQSIDKKHAYLVGIVLQSSIPKSVAQSKLSGAVFNIGSPVIADLSVAKETTALAKEIPDAAKSVSNNPLKVRELTASLRAIKFVASNIAPQATSASSILKELMAYASSNNISVPSDSEIKSKAQ